MYSKLNVGENIPVWVFIWFIITKRKLGKEMAKAFESRETLTGILFMKIK